MVRYLGFLLAAPVARASFFDAWLLPRQESNCTSYTLQDGDTCTSVGREHNATYAQLLSWNSDIDSMCSNLQELDAICVSNPDGDYSLPTNSNGGGGIITTTAPPPAMTPPGTTDRCGEFHLVEEGDDCAVIASEYGITKKDFLFLNTQLFENCTNLLLDVYYCVAPVGYIITYPGYDGSATRPPFEETPSTPVPFPDNPWENYTSNNPAIPMAKGTRVDCYKYQWFADVTNNRAAECWGLCRGWGVTREDFILWNPSLGEGYDEGGSTTSGSIATTTTSQAYTYPCTLSASLSYCVQRASSVPATPTPPAPPNPRASGEPEDCTVWLQVTEGSDCETLRLTYFLSAEDFLAMNPTVGDECTGLVLGTYYCVSTDPDPAYEPTPTFETGSGTTAAPTQSG